jgi:16S rRNA (cytosine967-C5)-methyltransferase
MHSQPEWLAAQWFDQLGAADARALMAANNEPAEVALRVNTLRTDRDSLASALPVAYHADPLLPEALVLDGPWDAHGSSPWRDGWFLAQSRAAMLVAHVLDPQPHERVLDLCAAPGSKTTHIAALMGNDGEVVAVERNRKRAEQLEATVARLGARNVTVRLGDARDSGGFGTFDRVLVDPPCSGLGTLQGNADLRWRVTPDGVPELAKQQMSILASGAACVGTGGVLVYSTCTISPPENERLIGAFLDANSDFQLDDLGGRFPALCMDRLSGSSGAHALAPQLLLTLPHRDRTAGFFIARMRRV